MINILARNIVVYVILALVLFKSVDWDTCFKQRGRYLLGIAYNGRFQNALDNQIYIDYLKRHQMDHDTFVRDHLSPRQP